MHTNDIHGWINGNRHIPVLDADIADYYNFFKHAKELLTNHVVHAFDSGDQTQGTGLSDYIKTSGEFIFEKLEQVPFDGFTIGNHEMYNNSCIDNIADKNVSTSYIYNSQSLRAPLYQGHVTLDDFVKVDPSFSTFCAFRGVTGQDMRQLMSTLFDPAFKNMNYEVSFGEYYLVTDDAQKLFNNKEMDEYYEYDIITASYDCPPISYIFQNYLMVMQIVAV
ncbi:MAG: hypothetical protein EZS28_014813 [Streblomastix strix]|uniref:Calcineurin-like phosphoesterase domain-containing protein n=1 Tax=Streblomastix strix TaxID=222440 RepID=A0A5J4W414_9EUKA|nr:MAG: hypothetical protein EZS28_014813 [Streblomastix strix]